MAYIGQKPFQEFSSIPTKDSFTGDGSTTTFDLANDVVRGAEFALEVFIDNVRQEPGSGKAFTLGIDGSNNYRRITFTAAPANGASIYVINDKTNLTTIAPVQTDFNGVEIVLDADSDTTLHAETDDQVDLRIAGNDVLKFLQSSGDAVLKPMVDAKDIIFQQFDGNKIFEINDGNFVGVGGNATAPGEIRIYEDSDNGSNYSGFKAAASTTSSVAYQLPAADGSSGESLTTNGSGVLSWSAGVTIANDTNNRIVTADGSSGLNGEANLTFDGTTLALTGNSTVSGTLGVSGVTTSNAGVVVDNITIDGTEIDLSSGDLTVDVAGDIKLDAAGGDVQFLVDGTLIGNFGSTSNDFRIVASVQDKDIVFKGNDGGADLTALTLDMSEAGAATFNNAITSGAVITSGAGLVIADAGTIGSASDTDAIAIASNGQVTLTQTLIGTALDISGDIDVDGTTNLDVVDIDGAVDMASTLQVDGAITTSADVTVGGTLNASSTQIITSNTPIISFIESDQSNKQYQIGSFGGAFAIYDQSNTEFRYIIDTNGNHIFNEGSADCDFRVESNGQANMLFVDGGNDRVHINGTTGTREFNVSGDNTRLLIYSTNNSSGAGQLQFGDADNEQIGRIMYEHDDNNMTFHTNNTQFMELTSTGKVVLTGGTATSTSDLTTGGIHFHDSSTADGNIMPITFTPSATANRARAGIGFISQSQDGSAGFAADIAFYTRGAADGSTLGTSDERMRIHSGGVVSIPGGIELGSGLDATAANTLDDYEEGNWTPELESNTGDNIDNYDSQVGRYVKVGRQVRCSCYIDGGTKGTVNGSVMRIGSLPFTPDNDVGYQAGTIGYWNNIDIDDRQLMLAVYGDNNFAYLFRTTTDGGGVQVTPSNILDDSRIAATIFYETDS